MKIDETIEALEKRLKEAKDKKRKIDAKKKALESKKQRSEDTRRKILVGAAIISIYERGESPPKDLRLLVETMNLRPDEKPLFEPTENAQPVQQKTDGWIFLNVAFDDNPAVKALGAGFDREKKKWFITTNQDKEPFAKWLP